MVTTEHAAAIQRLAYSPTTKKLVVQMHEMMHGAVGFDRKALEALPVPAPDSLLGIPQESCAVTGVMVTVRSAEPQFDFYSRYFAPWNGIPEDPGLSSVYSLAYMHTCMHAHEEQVGQKMEARYDGAMSPTCVCQVHVRVLLWVRVRCQQRRQTPSHATMRILQNTTSADCQCHTFSVTRVSVVVRRTTTLTPLEDSRRAPPPMG